METTDTQTRDIILRLKRVKAARGLSCGRICAMVAEAGSSVSLSTVKRVFADGSEDWSFRVCDTVQPIADVLLAEGGAPEVGSCERAAYQAIAEQQRRRAESRAGAARSVRAAAAQRGAALACARGGYHAAVCGDNRRAGGRPV